MSSKQLTTQLQAEYLVELQRFERLKKEFEASQRKMERLVLLLQQDEKIRLIRDRKYEQQV